MYSLASTSLHDSDLNGFGKTHKFPKIQGCGLGHRRYVGEGVGGGGSAERQVQRATRAAQVSANNSNEYLYLSISVCIYVSVYLCI